ncbi:MAG: hypothetical protein OXI61_05770 [Candidatus Poribacteria bacterium]|nr:hypothetical protein [Candidatus Poribacteria bacterium]
MSEISTSLKILFSVVLKIRKSLDPKVRMKKKILRKLNEEADKGNLLFSKIRLRDDLLSQHRLAKRDNRLRNFYKLFMRSIRDLETKGKIIRVSNGNLEFPLKDGVKNYPSYSSKAKKTPADCGLKEDEPEYYLGLNSQEVQRLVESLAARRQSDANRFYEGAALNMSI